MTHCIYKHTFPDGKVYIGQTQSGAAERRWKKNGEGYKKSPKVYEAIKRFGWDNVKHEILEDGIDEDRIDERERYYIDQYDSVKNGYNMSLGGKNIKDHRFWHKESSLVHHALKKTDYADIESYLRAMSVWVPMTDGHYWLINECANIVDTCGYRKMFGHSFLQEEGKSLELYSHALTILFHSTQMAIRIAGAAYEAGENIGSFFADAYVPIKADECARAMAKFARMAHQHYEPIPQMAEDYLQEIFKNEARLFSKGEGHETSF